VNYSKGLPTQYSHVERIQCSSLGY